MNSFITDEFRATDTQTLPCILAQWSQQHRIVLINSSCSSTPSVDRSSWTDANDVRWGGVCIYDRLKTFLGLDRGLYPLFTWLECVWTLSECGLTNEAGEEPTTDTTRLLIPSA